MRYKVLTRNNEFSRAYTRGKSFVNPLVVLYVNKNRLNHVRIGLTATKKIGNAVKRNRARRVMRAALDMLFTKENLNAHGYDIVLVARGKTPYKKSWQVAKALHPLLIKAGVSCVEPVYPEKTKKFSTNYEKQVEN